MSKWICKSFEDGECCVKTPCKCEVSWAEPSRCVRDGYGVDWEPETGEAKEAAKGGEQ